MLVQPQAGGKVGKREKEKYPCVLVLVFGNAVSLTGSGAHPLAPWAREGGRWSRSLGLSSPDALSIQAAIEANDRFIAELEAIRDRAINTIES
jgi:hypothetical protein